MPLRTLKDIPWKEAQVLFSNDSAYSFFEFGYPSRGRLSPAAEHSKTVGHSWNIMINMSVDFV